MSTPLPSRHRLNSTTSIKKSGCLGGNSVSNRAFFICLKKSPVRSLRPRHPPCAVLCVDGMFFRSEERFFRSEVFLFRRLAVFFTGHLFPLRSVVAGAAGRRVEAWGAWVWVAGRTCCSVSYENPAGILTSAPKKDDFSAENAIFAENNELAGTAPRVGIRLPRTQKCYIFRYETHIYSRPLRD